MTLPLLTEEQCKIFDTASRSLIRDNRAEAIMLGGTDLALAFSEKDAPFPVVDCGGIHADAIARSAIP